MPPKVWQVMAAASDGFDGVPLSHASMSQSVVEWGTSLSSTWSTSMPPRQMWLWQSPSTAGTPGVGVPSARFVYTQVPVWPSHPGVEHGPLLGHSAAVVQMTTHTALRHTPAE